MINPLTVGKVRNYSFFLIMMGAILSLTTIKGTYLLAPPFAVSAYLIVFQNGGRYAKKGSIAATYMLVVSLSGILQLLFGDVLIGMIAEMILITAFITFTNFSHPPAIALTIFSYISANLVDFAFSSFLVLAILLLGAHLIERYGHRMCSGPMDDQS